MLLVLARADQQTVHPLLGFGYPQILYLKIHNTLIIADSNFWNFDFSNVPVLILVTL